MTKCAFCGEPAECLAIVRPDIATWGRTAPAELTVRACFECAGDAGPILYPLNLEVSVRPDLADF